MPDELDTVPIGGLRARLAANTPVLGMWAIVPSPGLVEIAAASGLDFVILDCEHGNWVGESLENGIRACHAAKRTDGKRCAAFVRVAGCHPEPIQTALDLGADGIIVPRVDSFEAAQQVLQFMRYAPDGSRGFNPFTRGNGYGTTANATEAASQSVVSCLIIENRAAWDALPEILGLPDLDVVYLGVYDMSVELGVPGEIDHPEVMRFVHEATAQIVQAGKTVGLLVHDIGPPAEKFLTAGVRFFVLSVDSFLFGRIIRQAVGLFEQAGKGIVS